MGDYENVVHKWGLYCEYGNEPSDSVRSIEFLDQLSGHQLLKKDCVSWS
jgi:hypothetical protein